MRVMFILRLYTGFEAALLERRPVFSGTTAVANLITGLVEAGHTVRIVFARRAGPLKWREKRDVDVVIEGLNAQITVLAGEDRFPSLPGFLRRRLAYWRHLGPMRRAISAFRPDILYVDRGHLMPAALFSRMSKVPVVWRVLGVPDTLREVIDWRGPRGWLWHWLLRSPFAGVISTVEGSGAGQWLARVLRPGVPRYDLLSGRPEQLALSKPLPALPPDETRIVFVGRLEPSKGCSEFISAFVQAAQQAPGLHAVMVGFGSLKEALARQAAESGMANRVTLTGAVDHRTALAILSQADIYVSLNQTGNLSNANLEALAAGVCMIIPQSDPDTGVDLDTDETLPADVAYRFGRFDEVGKLADAILKFHRDVSERKARAARGKIWAQENVLPWSQRIAKEISILQDLAAETAKRRGQNSKKPEAELL